MPLRKFASHKSTVADAIGAAMDEFTQLAEDVREVVDNASGTARENTQRIQTMSETADTLEGLSEPDVSDTIGKIEVEYNSLLPRSARQPLSRADRCQNGIMALDAVVEVLEDLADKWDEENKDKENAIDPGYRELINEIENLKSDAEGCEFPGMYG